MNEIIAACFCTMPNSAAWARLVAVTRSAAARDERGPQTLEHHLRRRRVGA